MLSQNKSKQTNKQKLTTLGNCSPVVHSGSNPLADVGVGCQDLTHGRCCVSDAQVTNTAMKKWLRVNIRMTVYKRTITPLEQSAPKHEGAAVNARKS